MEIGSRLGPYQVTAKLGQGGMGEVWRARDARLDRDVALKIIPEALTRSPTRLARFKREAKVLASLNHPNIGHIYGLEEADGVEALVLELVDGYALSTRIARGPIALGEALPIAAQIALALETAHGQGIIHRDLKPANVMLKADGTAKLLDFGLAKALHPTPDEEPSDSPTITTEATTAGVLLGTAAYMSPEQARGEPAVSGAPTPVVEGLWRANLFETGAGQFDVSKTGDLVYASAPTPTQVDAGAGRSLRNGAPSGRPSPLLRSRPGLAGRSQDRGGHGHGAGHLGLRDRPRYHDPPDLTQYQPSPRMDLQRRGRAVRREPGYGPGAEGGQRHRVRGDRGLGRRPSPDGGLGSPRRPHDCRRAVRRLRGLRHRAPHAGRRRSRSAAARRSRLSGDVPRLLAGRAMARVRLRRDGPQRGLRAALSAARPALADLQRRRRGTAVVAGGRGDLLSSGSLGERHVLGADRHPIRVCGRAAEASVRDDPGARTRTSRSARTRPTTSGGTGRAS